MPSRDGLLVLAQCYPPAVGGSGELIANVYSRIPEAVVLTDVLPTQALRSNGATGLQTGRTPAQRNSLQRVVRERFDIGQGLRPVASGASHLRLARAVRRLTTGSAVVHCARALPEGTVARLASIGSRRRYVCWTHGEELPIAARSRELTWLMRRVHRGAAALLANSENTASLLREWGNATDKVHVVHPGVEADRFPPDAPGREAIRRRFSPRGETILLSVGRLQRRKGHDLALQALADRDLAQRIHYVIVGDGEDVGRLTSLAGELGIAAHVTFAGEVPRNALPDYYAAADVFLLPNRVEGADFEGFGIVFLEAAAAGLPTIGGRSGGVPEAIQDGVTGRLVGGSDADELRMVLRQLVDSHDVRRQMGAAGRERVLRSFTWERAAARVAEIDRAIRATR